MSFEIHHGNLNLKLFNKENDLILLKKIFETGVYCTPNTRVFKAKYIIEIAGQLHDFNLNEQEIPFL